MINLGTGPSIIIGFIVSLTSISLYITRIIKPDISKDQDILFMTIGLIYSSILIIHGWRLDPILIFSQILLVSTTIFFGYENLTLRNIKIRRKGLKSSKKETNVKHKSSKNFHNRFSEIKKSYLASSQRFPTAENLTFDLLCEYKDLEEYHHK
nr:hypothetical protein Ycf66 [Cavernulicola chilensis]